MIQRIASFAGLILLTVSFPSLAATTYGEGILLEESTPLVELQADPAAFEGARLRAEGRIVAVAPGGGLVRIEDTEANGLWVRSGEWVWTEDLTGLYAVVEGDVVAMLAEIRQRANELGLGPAGDEPMVLQAVGAIIGEVEAIVMDGSVAGVMPIVLPGVEGEGTGGPAGSDGPEAGTKDQQ